MLAAQRQELLLRRLESEGRIVAKDIAAELQISEDSIRRDLRELAAAGLCQRVYGGALPVSPAIADLQTRTNVQPDSKLRVATRAARLITPGTTAILDGGTTALAVARSLPPDLRATIVTHSPTVAVEAARHPGVDIVMLGGRLYRHSMVNVGAAVIEAAARVRADLYFMGVTGVHPDEGLTTGDAEEAAVKRALHARAAETIVLASAEKLLAASPFMVAPLADVGLVVVPPGTAERVVRALRACGVKLKRLSRR